MKCPKCQHENPEGLKFCVECGNKLEIICSNCGFGNAPSFKFCGECGQNLTLPSKLLPKDLSFDEKIDKIQRYLPKGLTEKILSQRDRIEGERKQVTVMFCDMEGFTQLTARLGPEEAYNIMDQIYEILIHKVHDYEGTVNEMTGDGIMALFGAPIALEDAPQRAIRSAHAIHREMTRLNDKIEQEIEGVQPLRMRIGIHTGPVVVGTLGNDLRVEFKAVGDTVNMASRMEGLAQPGTSYVTDETFKLTEGFFRFEGLGERQVKGKEKPVRVYRVIAPSTRRTRFDVSAERGLTPFVGRERELELLLDGFERSKTGRGQAFSIMAEAGVGKSRLLYEFRKAVSNEDVTFLEGKCLSYSRGVAYHPVIDILKSNFDIREGDGDSEIREKVERQLKKLKADQPSTLTYLLALLSVRDSRIDNIPMSPEGKKDRIMESVKRITLKSSEIRPVVVAIEDLHWIDKSSEEYFKDLLDSISGARVFLIFTYRPEFVHTWGRRSYHNQVTLNRLSNRESLWMVSNLLGTEKIHRDLEELILDKTEGVPFFIEEFIKSLKDLNMVERKGGKYLLAKDIKDVTIPATIQDVIMARVDILPEGAKGVLQTGSVIEREFSYDLIKRVTDLPEQELLSHFSILKDLELIYERGIFPEITYIFKHALTREVVYDSILTKRRKMLHEDIGNTIESLYQDRLEEFYEILAYHYSKTEKAEKAIEYWHMAGRRALKLYAVDETTEYFTRAFQKIEELPPGNNRNDLKLEVGTKLGFSYLLKNMYSKAIEIVQPLEELAIEKRHLRSLGRIYTTTGTALMNNELDIKNGIKYLKRSIELSRQTKDIPALIFGSSQLAWAYFVLGDLDAVKKEYWELVSVLEKKQDWYTLSPIYFALSSLFCIEADIENAEKWSRKAYECIDKLDDPFTKSWGNLAVGKFCLEKGKFDDAEEKLSMALDNATDISLHIALEMCLIEMIQLYLRKGEYDSSLRYIQELHDSIEHRDAPLIYLVPCLVLEAEICLHLGKLEKALECLETGKKYQLPLYEGILFRVLGDYFGELGPNNFQTSKEWYERAVKSHDRIGMNLELGRDLFSYGEVLKREGSHKEAEEYFNKALNIFRPFRAMWDIHQVEEAMRGL